VYGIHPEYVRGQLTKKKVSRAQVDLGLVIGYDALFGKSRMSYIRPLFVAVYTAVVVCASDTVYFL
jgi:hypothetical protein